MEEVNKEHFDYLWRHFLLLVDLTKFYFDLAIKAYALSAAISGGLLAFYLQAGDGHPVILIIPLAVNVGVGWISHKAIPLVGNLGKGIDALIKRGLDRLIVTVPEVTSLQRFLRLGEVVAAASAIFTLYLLVESLWPLCHS